VLVDQFIIKEGNLIRCLSSVNILYHTIPGNKMLSYYQVLCGVNGGLVVYCLSVFIC